MERLIIRLHDDGRLSWSAAGLAGGGGEGVPDPARIAQAREIVALVPGEHVTLYSVQLPRGSRAKLRQALPFVLEDQVLDPVDSLHFSLGPQCENGEHAVAVVAVERLQQWLSRLREAGIQADAMVADVLALALEPGHASVIVEDGRAMLRLDEHAGFACAATELPARLQLLPADLHIDAYVQDGAVLPPDERLRRHAQADAAMRVGPGLGASPALNLLHDDYAPHHRRAPQQRLWRLAAMFACAALVLGLADQVVAIGKLKSASARTQEAISARYRQAFPQGPPTPDPVARVRSELTRLSGAAAGDGLLPLLTRIAPVLSSQGQGMTLVGLEYHGNAMELALRTRDLAALDSLRERLATLPGLNVELTAATPDSNGVQGRVRIRAGGA